ADVEQRDVGRELLDQLQSAFPVARTAEELEATLGLEKAADRIEDGGMIVGHHAADGTGRSRDLVASIRVLLGDQHADRPAAHTCARSNMRPGRRGSHASTVVPLPTTVSTSRLPPLRF